MTSTTLRPSPPRARWVPSGRAQRTVRDGAGERRRGPAGHALGCGRVRGPKVEVLADWTWTGWSSVQALRIVRDNGAPLSTVPLKFEDTWRVGGGFNYRLNETWKLQAGRRLRQGARPGRVPDAAPARPGPYLGGDRRSRPRSGRAPWTSDMRICSSRTPPAICRTRTRQAPPSGNLVGSYQASVNILSIQIRRSF